MNLQIAVLCDAATDSAGKLSLLGAFDTIQTAQLPALYPQCSVALRMMFNNGEEGMHTLRLSFVDEDGQLVMPSMELPMPVEVPADTHFVTRNLIVNIQQLKFAKPGLYSIDIAYDGRQEAGIPLMVRHTPGGANVMTGQISPGFPFSGQM